MVRRGVLHYVRRFDGRHERPALVNVLLCQRPRVRILRDQLTSKIVDEPRRCAANRPKPAPAGAKIYGNAVIVVTIELFVTMT